MLDAIMSKTDQITAHKGIKDQHRRRRINTNYLKCVKCNEGNYHSAVRELVI